LMKASEGRAGVMRDGMAGSGSVSVLRGAPVSNLNRG